MFSHMHTMIAVSVLLPALVLSGCSGPSREEVSSRTYSEFRPSTVMSLYDEYGTLHNKVTLRYGFPEDCIHCGRAEAVIKDLETFFSPALQLEELPVTEVGPRLVCTPQGETHSRISYWGYPYDYGLNAVASAIAAVGCKRSSLEAPVRKLIAQITTNAAITVYVDTSCLSCMVVSGYAYAMAAENKMISVRAIDIKAYPEMAQREEIKVTPTIVYNHGKAYDYGGVEPLNMAARLLKLSTASK